MHERSTSTASTQRVSGSRASGQNRANGLGGWRSSRCPAHTRPPTSFLRSRRVRLASMILFSLANRASRSSLPVTTPAPAGRCGREPMAGRDRGDPLLRCVRAQGRGLAPPVRAHERPGSHALAAANAAASVTGVALPGRLDDVVRLAVARRFSSRAGIGAIVSRSSSSGSSTAPRSTRSPLSPRGSRRLRRHAGGLGLVAGVGVARGRARARTAAALAAARASPASASAAGSAPTRPRARTHSRLGDRLGVVGVRALALFVLLGALGLGHSFPLALLFLTASAASAALPLGPAGAATQAGAGAAVLVLAGVPTRRRWPSRSPRRCSSCWRAPPWSCVAGAWEARLRLVAGPRRQSAP